MASVSSEMMIPAFISSLWHPADRRTRLVRLGWVALFLTSPILGSAVHVAAPHVAAGRYLQALFAALRALGLWLAGLCVFGFLLGLALAAVGQNPFMKSSSHASAMHAAI